MRKIKRTIEIELSTPAEEIAELLAIFATRPESTVPAAPWFRAGSPVVAGGPTDDSKCTGQETQYTGVVGIVLRGPDSEGDYFVLHFDDDGSTTETYIHGSRLSAFETTRAL
jgi:hypothetical protein